MHLQTAHQQLFNQTRNQTLCIVKLEHETQSYSILVFLSNGDYVHYYVNRQPSNPLQWQAQDIRRSIKGGNP